MTTPLTTSSRVLQLFDVGPGLLVLCALLRKNETPLLVFLLQYEAFDALAQRDNLGGVDVVANGKLTRGDDTLGLKANVEQDFVVVDLDNGAQHQVAVFELKNTVADQGRKVGADQVVFGDDARDVVPSFVESSPFLGRRGGSWRPTCVLLSFDRNRGLTRRLGLGRRCKPRKQHYHLTN